LIILQNKFHQLKKSQ